MVGKFRPDLEGCVARWTVMWAVSAVILDVSAQTTARRVHSRTQRAPVAQNTCINNVKFTLVDYHHHYHQHHHHYHNKRSK